MKIPSIIRSLSRRLVGALLGAAFILGAMPVNEARAQFTGDDAAVSYAPTSSTFQGPAPLTRTFVITVTAPVPLAGPVTIAWDIPVVSRPTTITDATARSYVTVTPSTLTFNGAGQSLNATVSINLPADAALGSYGYKVIAAPTSGSWGGATNVGHSINSTLTEPPAGTPPTVAINNPSDGQQIINNSGVFPFTLPYSFTTTSNGTGTLPPITSTAAEISGSASLTYATRDGLNTPSVITTGSITVPAAGTYTLVARGTNTGGTAADTHTFTVVAPSAPVVTITTPTDGEQFSNTTGAFPYSVPFTFTATVPGPVPSPITAVSATLNNTTAVTISTSGLNTTSVTGTGTLLVPGPGTHTVRARAVNAIGEATDVNEFVVVVAVPPPVAAISSPANGATFTYKSGEPALSVTFNCTGSTTGGGIRSLTATLDGLPLAMTVSNLQTLLASGTAALALDADDAGPHTLVVETTDIYGQVATATSTFNVQVLNPAPAISISKPTPSQVFTLPTGATTMGIPYEFLTTTNAGFTITSVSAQLGTTILTPSTSGLGTTSATSTGTVNLGVGSYTLQASGISGGRTVTTNVQFSVRASSLVPPSVVINTPAAGSTYTLASGGSLTIPLTFTGTSNNATTVISGVTAKLGTTTLPVSATLNTKVVNATSSMTVSSGGTYTITVTATDAVGTATASRSFTVTVVTPKKVCGMVFFDVDRDGVYECAEFGLSGITVQLKDSTGVVKGSAVTNSGGSYEITGVLPGSYTVSAVATSGLNVTTPVRSVTVSSSNVTAGAIGLGLDFAAIRTMTASGSSHGFWKSNIDKAIACKPSGAQVSATAINNYTRAIGDFAMRPYDCISMKTASSVLGSTSSQPKDLLSKQLLAAEYNYQHGANIGGNRTLTFLFVYWGEYVLNNQSSFSSTYIVWAKDWFDAYNNSYGGLVRGPQ